MPDTDRTKLLQASVRREGVVADGVTLLSLRVRSSVPVKFSVIGAPDRGVLLKPDGTLGDRNGQELTSPLETVGAEKVAFAVYRVPLDRVASQVAIDAVSNLGSGRKTLTLYSPPVVLVHGVWSDGFAWYGLEQRLLQAGFDTFERVDYGSIPGQAAGSFDPLATDPNNQIVIGAMHTTTQYALTKMRQLRNVAVTQVDVVGHSMGGLVARARTKSSFPQPYERPGNYKKGYFHKLITVGSPHRGSPLADWLSKEKCNHAIGLNYTPDLLFRTVFRREIGPAIFEFQSSSNALKNIGVTRVPSHAIVGIAPDNSDTEDNLNTARQATLRFSDSIDNLLGGNGRHDTIVPDTSQRGGLPDNAYTQQSWGIVHADIEPFENYVKQSFGFTSTDDTAETASTKVWDRVIELLSTSTSQSTFAYLPPLTNNNNPEPFKVCQSLSLAPFRPAEGAAAATISPAPGTVVHPGDVVQVSFSITGGGPIDGALFAINSRFKRVEGSGPFTLSFVVPATRAGRIVISAISYGGATALVFASTYLMVVPGATIASLNASPSDLSFEQAGEQFQLHVTGQFSDGETLDLTSSTAGTTYNIKSGTTSIVSVSPEGVLRANGFGQETVLITNAGKTASISVYIGSSGAPTEAILTSVSAASFSGASLAPESIVAAFGVNLASEVIIASSTPLPERLAGTSMTVRDSVGTERAAAIFFVSPSQINFQIPPGTATGVATFTVNKAQGFTSIGTALIEGGAPALFTANASGKGVPAASVLRVRTDGSQSYEPVARYDAAQGQFVPAPIELGPQGDQVYLLLFGTGLRFRSDLSAVKVMIGGAEAQVLYAGDQGGFVGLDQINLLVPRSLIGRGEVDISLLVDGVTANQSRVSIR